MQSTCNAKSCGFAGRNVLNYFYCWKLTIYSDSLGCLRYPSRLEKFESGFSSWGGHALLPMCSCGSPQVISICVLQPLALSLSFALGSRLEVYLIGSVAVPLMGMLPMEQLSSGSPGEGSSCEQLAGACSWEYFLETSREWCCSWCIIAVRPWCCSLVVFRNFKKKRYQDRGRFLFSNLSRMLFMSIFI